jgi:O-methyltransferase / aklanonic acid methyltransferase
VSVKAEKLLNLNDEEAKVKDQAAAAAAWGRAAATYSHVGPHFFQYFGKRLVEMAPIHPGDKVLDVAAGRGAVLFPAAAKAGPQGQVTGIDFSAGMVQQTNVEIESLGIPNARMLQMDAERLEFPDDTFDCVLCGFAIFFFPHLDQALAEFRRVLKPGGVLAVTTWGRGDERWKWLDDLAAYSRLNQVAKNKDAPQFGKPDGMEAILTGAGFVNISVTEEAVEFLYEDEEEWWATQWSHGARLSMETTTPEALERDRSLVHQKLKELERPEGIPHNFLALYSIATK